MRKGRVVTKDLSLENLYLDGNNISNKKINSNFVVDTLINKSASLKGDLNIKLDNIDILSDLKAKGNISISNLDLKILAPYMERSPYKLDGTINYSSFLDYSRGDITSKGSFSASDLYIKDPGSMEISVDNIRSKINFRLKKEEITLKTIDKFSDEHIIPNIIRMDTEGYEIEIFRGAERTLKNPILKHLFIELHPTLRTHEEMIELLKTLQTAGFEITHVILKDRIDDIVRTDISIYDLIENPKYLEYSLETFFSRK